MSEPGGVEGEGATPEQTIQEAPAPAPDPVEKLLAGLQYTFQDRRLLHQALTHRSYVNECNDPAVRDNERLEFLGDAVIDLIVSEELMRRHPEAQEGALSKMRASVVSEGALARQAERLELGAALRLGRGEQLSGGREKPSLLSDAFEAVMAAVYLDGGFERVREILLDRLEFPVGQASPRGDAKTELQQRVQAAQHITPSYRVVEEQGPDHSKLFVVELLIGNEVRGTGQGRTKKEAEQSAAAAVLASLSERD